MKEEEVQPSDAAAAVVHDQDLRSSASDRLMEVYDQITASDDVAAMTAAFLTTSNYYTYAMRISNEINGRQGKNRLSVNEHTISLVRYSLDDNIDEITDDNMYRAFIDTLNQYLIDKQELPSNDRVAKGIIGRVKALFIMLVTTGQVGIISHLTIPNYMLEIISNLYTRIREMRNEALDSFIQYLEKTNNTEMIEILRPIGSDFWGSEGTKANVVYDKYFGAIQDKIKMPVETYNMYKKCRDIHSKNTKTILPSILYDLFEITPDSYNAARKNVYSELQVLFKGQVDTDKVTRRLLFGPENDNEN